MSTETGGKQAPTARRLRAVRIVEGYKVAKLFAKDLGIEPSRLSNMENGFPISTDVANKIWAKFRVDPSWLLHGLEGNLTVSLRDRLRAQLAADEKGTTTPSRSRGGDGGA